MGHLRPDCLLLRIWVAHRRFADTHQDFFCGWDIEERLADMPPSLTAINVNEQSCIQRNVLSVHTGTAMQ
jgi:hypothetical protein